MTTPLEKDEEAILNKFVTMCEMMTVCIRRKDWDECVILANKATILIKEYGKLSRLHKETQAVNN